MLYYTIKISVKMISLWWSAKKGREKIKKEYDFKVLENDSGLYDIVYHRHNNDGNFNANEETDYDEDMMPKVEDAKKDLIDLEQQFNMKKEQYLKVQGAVEALTALEETP